MSEPCDLGAVEARALIGRRKLSPVELTESCIARIEATDHAINAMVARDFERARGAAKVAEQAVMQGVALGALHGLPVGIKDLTETAGLRTTFGSLIYRDHIPTHDDRVVADLRGAGAIVLGKTNTPEWGAGANTRNSVYGATGNPHDPTKSAAGSSGGSAAALAVSQVPIASGSDTGGSLRNPAAFCGVVGFRPSPGVVPSAKRGLGWSPLSTDGPMARNVADLCLLFSAMVGEHKEDPLAATIHGRRVRAAGDVYPPPSVDLSSLRVAATPDFGFAPVERHIREVFLEKIARMRPLFGRLTEATPDCRDADEAFAILRAKNFLAAHLEKTRKTPELVGPNVRVNVEEGLRYSAEDVARAEVLHTQYYRRWQHFYSNVDVVLSPCMAISPRPWQELFPTQIDGKPTKSYYHWLALPYAVTLATHPAVALPLGRDRHGMPFGLQIVGPRGGDAFVLGVAAALEAALAGDAELARPLPDLAKLKAASPISSMPEFMGFG